MDNKFDLIQLEATVRTMYGRFVWDETERTRKDLFMSIKDLAYAILNVGVTWRSLYYDKKALSFEYGTYMMERILKKRFVPPNPDDFPWQVYIDKSLAKVVYPLINDYQSSSFVDIADYEDILADEVYDTTRLNALEYHVIKAELGNDVLKGLLLYYTEPDIRRLYPIAMEFSTSHAQYALPKDIIEFIQVFKAIVSRLSSSPVYGIMDEHHLPVSVTQSMTGAVRSTVFLSSIVNDEFISKKLFMSLDIDSLYRLAYMSGGEDIRVPTVRELDSLTGVVTSITKVLMEGKSIEEAIGESKGELALLYSRNRDFSMKVFIEKLLSSIALLNEDGGSTPLANIVLASLSSFTAILDKTKKEMREVGYTSAMGTYAALLNKTVDISSFLLNTSDKQKEEFNEARQDT